MPKQPLKIGLVIDTSLDLEDGVQQYVLTIGNWLTRAGHDVHYIAGQTEVRDLPNLHSLSRNITVKFNGNRMNIPLWAKKRDITALLQEQPFDVLHIQTPHHPLMAQRIISRAADTTAVIATFHILPYNSLAAISNRFLGLWLKSSLGRIDQMLAVSSSAARFEQQTFHKPALVSPNVFNYTRFNTGKIRQEYDDDVLTILFLGRLVERKGCRYLLEAISQLDRTSVPAFRVVICGKGELKSELEAFTKTHGIDDIVEFTGFVADEDKAGYLASADIGIFPSTGGESFGIVLLEAMASGSAAVLAGDNPGYATVMEPRPELLFEPKDTAQLAVRITELLTNKEKRQEIAAWGREYTKKFDVETVGPQLVAIYEEVIAKRVLKPDNIHIDE